MWSSNITESIGFQNGAPRSTEECSYHSPGTHQYPQNLVDHIYNMKGFVNEALPFISEFHKSCLFPMAPSAVGLNNFYQYSNLGINNNAPIQRNVEDHDRGITVRSSIQQTLVNIAPAPLSLTNEYMNHHKPETVFNTTNTWKDDSMPEVQNAVLGKCKDSCTSARNMKMKIKTHSSGDNTGESGKRKPTPNRTSEKTQNIDAKWLSTFQELKKFKQRTGHTIVPRGYALNPKLASWVSEQRKQYRLHLNKQKASITPTRISLLKEVGFVWNAQTGAWERQFEQLEQYCTENGHCNVPATDETNMKLALWVKEQRRQYTSMKQGKESRMTLERFRRLSELRFCFSTHEERWQHRFSQLEKFKGKHGHCVVTNSNASSGLATWVHHQRRQYRKLIKGEISHLTMKRVEDLNSLGFVWSRNRSSRDENDSYSDDGDGDDDDSIGSSNNDTFSDAKDDDHSTI